MKKCILILSCILISISAFPGNEEFNIRFAQANEMYADGKYLEASYIYTELDSMGFKSFELFYNAGNSFYRRNEIGLSIFYYEKANLLNPDNEDLNHNLEMANLRVQNLPAVVPELSIISFFRKIIDYGSVQIWGISGLVSFMLFMTLLFFYLKSNSPRTKKIRFLFSLILFFISLIIVIFTGIRYNKINSDNIAVVITDDIKGNSSPDASSTVLFRLYEGYKVNIEDNSKEWIEVKLTDGKKAWIKKEHVKIL